MFRILWNSTGFHQEGNLSIEKLLQLKLIELGNVSDLSYCTVIKFVLLINLSIIDKYGATDAVLCSMGLYSATD